MMLKSVVRNIIKEDHWAFLSWHKDRFGFLSTLPPYVRLLMNGDVAFVSNTVSSGGVFLRPGTADQNVFDEIFLKKEYEIDVGFPQVIVDAGAHIGLSSVYFAIRYPDSLIVALEPEDSNYRLLVQNSQRYSNIHPVKAGLWSHKTSLKIQNRDAASWSFRVIEAPEGGEIDALGIDDIMSMFNVNHIGILKLDIEGSEKAVLTTCRSWIDKVHTLIVELHDRHQPGCTEALDEAVRDRHLVRFMSGESVVLTQPREGALPN